MRIKALHIRNIASIEKADINFESELTDKATGLPASIFLISGDTGTGKSVILDAIAMALYKKTPRIVGVANRQNNDFTDERGETISIHSIEQYTRLGISEKEECYSEVVFTGNDGVEYCARLSLGLIKSRTKDENGHYILKHSTPSWTVSVGNDAPINVDSRTGQPILSAVGLTFEQFGRMAMLAQGQFASFLTGDKNERESILEQLTNTEHFTAYGDAINRLYRQANEAKRIAEASFNAEKEHTLSVEAVEEFQQNLKKLDEEEKIFAKQIFVAEYKIKLLDSLEQDHRTKAKSLEHKLQLEAEMQSDSYKDKKTFLHDWESTATERQRIVDLNTAQKTLHEAQVKDKTLQAQFLQLASDLKAREVEVAAQELNIGEERAWLDKQAERDTLYMTYPETKAQIEQIKQQLNRKKEIAQNIEKEKGKTAELQQKATHLKAQAEATSKAVNELQAAIDNIIEQRKLLNPEETNKQTIAITQDINALQNLKERIESHQANLEVVHLNQSSIQKETVELEQLKGIMEEEGKRFEAARKDAEAANARLTTMGESLKDTLKNLRKRLDNEKEEYCPLCGQKLERIYNEEDFIGMLSPIEKEQQRLAKVSATAESAYNAAKSKHDTAAGALNAKKHQLVQFIKQIEEEEIRIRHMATEKGLELGKTFETKALLGALRTLTSSKEEEKKLLEQKQSQLNALQTQQNELLAKKRSLDNEKSEADKQFAAAENVLNNNGAAITRLTMDAESIGSEIIRLRTCISTKLDRYYPNWISDMDSTLTQFIRDAESYMERKKALEKRIHHMEIARNTITTLQSQYETLHTEYPDSEATGTPLKYDCPSIMDAWAKLTNQIRSLKAEIKIQNERISECNKTLEKYYSITGKDKTYLTSISNRSNELETVRQYIKSIDENLKSHTDTINAAEERIKEVMAKLDATDDSNLPNKEEQQRIKQEANARKEDIIGLIGSIKQKPTENDTNIARRNKAEEDLKAAVVKYNKWELLNRYFGGTRFRTLVQTYVLRPLLNNANIYLEKITDRYKLTCREENAQLSILVHDLYNKGNVRSATILSGGERFMISLALSLALSSLNRPDMNVNILFIDEGFGTLDEKNLDSVMSTLEKLQEIAGQSNRRVGIISHREELNERIPVQIQVRRRGEGRSVVEIKNTQM